MAHSLIFMFFIFEQICRCSLTVALGGRLLFHAEQFFSEATCIFNHLVLTEKLSWAGFYIIWRNPVLERLLSHYLRKPQQSH